LSDAVITVFSFSFHRSAFVNRQPIAVARPRWCICHVSGFFVRVAVATLLITLVGTRLASGQESPEDAMAAYADAANFQTGGAFDLAVDGWKQFLKKYPDDPLVSKAAHYLGVCYMQREPEDYTAAAEAFAKALRDEQYELREESLANRGWCLYASSGEGQQRDPKRLRAALDTFAMLRKENPKSRYLDRALFYSGESAYALGQLAPAIEFYDQLLAMPEVQDSPLRCDALYARGVAQEDLAQYDKAIASYRQLLSSCKQKDGLVTDVHLRLGDLLIRRDRFAEASESFADAFESTESKQDRAYALFRQGYALAQLGKPGEAAQKYEQVLREHPDSSYSAAATLASAQSLYREGEFAQAAERFRAVLSQNSVPAATEAAHWLARIEIAAGKVQQAAAICRRQIQAGVDGDYATALTLDLAEVLSLDASTLEESMVLFLRTFRQAPDDPLAPRALYNAAFSAYQMGRPEQALQLSLEFINKFPQHTLAPDVQFVAAECQRQTGKAAEAADSYQALLASTARDNVQRPTWVLFAAAACNAAGRYDDAITMLQAEQAILKQPAQRAEAQFLIGRAQRSAGRPREAAAAFRASRLADPDWARSDEASLLEGEAMLAAENKQQATDTWQRLIQDEPDSRAADQARYKLAQLANADEQFEKSVTLYDEILDAGRDPSLIPYALYGKGWSLIQLGKYDAALTALDQVLRDNDQHSVRNDAVLARGITLRNLGRLDDAKIDLESYLTVPPKGTNLGHALYELALIDQKQNAPGKAAQRLERLVAEVPDYPSMDKVLYELGWSHRESGNDDAAVRQFTHLIKRYRETPLAAEAAYFVGQKQYAAGAWNQAIEQFRIAAENSDDPLLSEKAFYRLGWCHFKSGDYQAAGPAFQQQASKFPNGKLALDAKLMNGECLFKQSKFEAALAAYEVARQQIRHSDDNAKSVRDPAERRLRELVLLHGGQSASQLKKWQDAIGWLAELRQRFPATSYMPQAFYETGFAYQQLGDTENALKFFGEVADNFRNETAARARFMMGEIRFGNKQLDQAIPDFQRVMFGFGAEQATDEVKNWQAKSGFEAGRCSELLLQQARSKQSQDRARKMAIEFFTYVVDKHPDHDLVSKSRDRLEALKQK
jgi:TolA-binding protein